MKIYNTGMNLFGGIAFFIRYKRLQTTEYWLEKGHPVSLTITSNLKALKYDLESIIWISGMRK